MLKSFRSLAQAIDKFRTLDSSVPARLMHAFTVIAGWDPKGGEEGPSMRELGEELGITPTGVTRLVQALGTRESITKKGLNVVEIYIDTADRRSKRVRLNARGRTLKAQLINIME